MNLRGKERTGSGSAYPSDQGPNGTCFLAYKSKGQLSAFLLDYMGNHTPTYDFTGEDEVRHTLYVMNEPLKVQEVTRLLGRSRSFI